MKIIVALRHRDRMVGQVDKDNRAAARRLAKLQTSVEKLRAKVRRDLRSSDPGRFMTALAVALLDETGQDPVAAKKKHVRLSEDDPGNVSLKLTKGRSRRVAAPHVIQALVNAYETIDDDDDSLFSTDMARVTSERVEAYLADQNLTSEKLRGFSANRLIQERLGELRSGGSELPSHWKSKQKMLRGEYEQALSETASTVGIEAATIRAKYIMPGLEASYLKDGSFGLREASTADRTMAVSVWLRTL